MFVFDGNPIQMQENLDNVIICLCTKNFSSNRVAEALQPLNIFSKNKVRRTERGVCYNKVHLKLRQFNSGACSFIYYGPV